MKRRQFGGVYLYYTFLLAALAHKAYDAPKPLCCTEASLAGRMSGPCALHKNIRGQRYKIILKHNRASPSLNLIPVPPKHFAKHATNVRKVDSHAVLAFCMTIAKQFDLTVSSERLSQHLAQAWHWHCFLLSRIRGDCVWPRPTWHPTRPSLGGTSTCWTGFARGGAQQSRLDSSCCQEPATHHPAGQSSRSSTSH